MPWFAHKAYSQVKHSGGLSITGDTSAIALDLADAIGAYERGSKGSQQSMLSLVRFVIILAILAGVGYGAMFALVALVEPNTREMTVRVPSSSINPSPAPMPRAAPELIGPVAPIDPSSTGEIPAATAETPAGEDAAQ